MSDIVSAAAPSGGIQWAELKGKLLIIEPLSVEQNIQTAYGAADAVRANVHALTGPGESEVYEDSLVFPKLLQGQLRTHIGAKVVGRLGSGVAKPGQSAPHLLEEATAEDLEKAKSYLANKGVTTAAPPAATAPF